MISVVTGGTSGIGAAIVKRLLAESRSEKDIIVVNYAHNVNRANEFIDSLNENDSKKIRLFKADMSNFDSMSSFVAEILNISDKIDNLILNAAIGTYEKFDNYTLELWNSVINTNLTIPVFFVQKLKYHFSENANIVFLGSMMGHIPHSSSVVYSVSKAGIELFAKLLLKEFDGMGVRINTLCPGFIETPWQGGRSQESYDRINQKIAMHRFGTSEEVADVCSFVIKNGYINGEVIDIHGGYSYF